MWMNKLRRVKKAKVHKPHHMAAKYTKGKVPATHAKKVTSSRSYFAGASGLSSKRPKREVEGG